MNTSTMNEKRTPKAQDLIRRYMIEGERRFSNYWWATITFIGSTGFVLTGLSSFFLFDLVPFVSSKNIVFFPQGLLMLLYGTLGLMLTIYWTLLIFWNVGGGFNEFNKKEGFIRIFRWGYPGKQRKLDFSYSLKDVEAIRVEFLQGSSSLSLDQRRTIYLCLKGKREIPLTGVGEPLSLKEIEKQASELANFLQVSLEGL
uniref:Photosystem I assembly protein Ycf4 n=1 Tax=Hafniomonas laevis TaxID=436124 RepID=A0A0S2LPE0_9CHLO|nr:hypothetical chloroplast RF4 [Hafniomonas laevis]ALO63082.1 hypothetical chloroplast RF4 [Hafniomonas laevis]